MSVPVASPPAPAAHPTVAAPRSRRRRLPIHGAVSWFGVGCLVVFVLIATLGRLAGDPNELVAMGAEPPSLSHPFGTDHLGRDVLARTASGAWTSMLISTGAIAFALAVAVPLGLVAGYRHRRWTDTIVMRGLEGAQALPMFVFVLFIIGLTGTGDLPIGPVTISMEARIALCLGLGFIPFFARIARAATLVEVQEGYVPGLRALGVPTREILFGEILVNIIPALAVQALMALAIAIFAEGGLSFLGLGVAPPQATLGNLIAEASSQVLDGVWWYATLPGLVMVIGILGCNLVGDALNDSSLVAPPSGGASQQKDRVTP